MADITAELTQDQLLQRLEGVARKAVRDVLPPADYTLRMINHSENTTYLVEGGGSRVIVRVHRTGYHTRNAINSELTWMKALRQEAGVRTPEVIAGPDGLLIHHIKTDEVPGGRNCVLFEFLDGVEPDEENLLPSFPALGEVTAHMHRHSRGWVPPNGFQRFSWTLETSVGDKPHWGHWKDGLNLTPERIALFERLVETMDRRLKAFGTAPQLFGLVHADMRLANLLIDGAETRVIDFDDCGFSWYLWDFATALSFIEDRPDVPELTGAWLEGYRRIEPLSKEEEDEIPTFVLLRRLQLVAWIGSHKETDLAQEMGAEFTTGSCHLAEDYLGQFG